MDAGDPRKWGVFPGIPGDRALPGSSPTANLVGVWKGKRSNLEPLLLAVFYFLPFLPLPYEDICCAQAITYETFELCATIDEEGWCCLSSGMSVSRTISGERGKMKSMKLMKEITVLACTVVLSGFATTSHATSTMPEETMPSQPSIVCAAHVVYMPDPEKGTTERQTSSTLVFETSISKSEVLARITASVDEKLKEGNVSEFGIGCAFPKQ